MPDLAVNRNLSFGVHVTGGQQAALRGAVYAIEETLNPVDAVFLYQVIELTGEIADMAERVGRRLELLLSH